MEISFVILYQEKKYIYNWMKQLDQTQLATETLAEAPKNIIRIRIQHYFSSPSFADAQS